MASPKTLIVQSNDLSLLTGVTLTDQNLPGVYGASTRKGSHDDPADAQGLIGAYLPLAAYNFTVSVAVTGVNEADMEANLDALGAAVIGNNGLVTLARRRAKVGGGYNTNTAHGAFGGFANFGSPGPLDIELDLNFTNLDGAWWDSVTSLWLPL